MWLPWLGRKKYEDGEAEKALKEAERTLNEIKERGPQVTAVADALKELRERNHFAEQLEAIMIRRRREPT